MKKKVLLLSLFCIANVMFCEANDGDSKLVKKNVAALKKQGWKQDPTTKSLKQYVQIALATTDTTLSVGRGYGSGKTFHEAYTWAYLDAIADASMQVADSITITGTSSPESAKAKNGASSNDYKISSHYTLLLDANSRYEQTGDNCTEDKSYSLSGSQLTESKSTKEESTSFSEFDVKSSEVDVHFIYRYVGDEIQIETILTAPVKCFVHDKNSAEPKK